MLRLRECTILTDDSYCTTRTCTYGPFKNPWIFRNGGAWSSFFRDSWRLLQGSDYAKLWIDVKPLQTRLNRRGNSPIPNFCEPVCELLGIPMWTVANWEKRREPWGSSFSYLGSLVHIWIPNSSQIGSQKLTPVHTPGAPGVHLDAKA